MPADDTDCSQCRCIPTTMLVQTGYDERFPDEVYQFIRLHLDHHRDLYRCQLCNALFDWEDLPQMYGSGNLDEERLTRLTDEQAELVHALLALTAEQWTPSALIDRAQQVLPNDLLIVLRRQSI